MPCTVWKIPGCVPNSNSMRLSHKLGLLIKRCQGTIKETRTQGWRETWKPKKDSWNEGWGRAEQTSNFLQWLYPFLFWELLETLMTSLPSLLTTHPRWKGTDTKLYLPCGSCILSVLLMQWVLLERLPHVPRDVKKYKMVIKPEQSEKEKKRRKGRRVWRFPALTIACWERRILRPAACCWMAHGEKKTRVLSDVLEGFLLKYSSQRHKHSQISL